MCNKEIKGFDGFIAIEAKNYEQKTVKKIYKPQIRHIPNRKGANKWSLSDGYYCEWFKSAQSAKIHAAKEFGKGIAWTTLYTEEHTT